MSAFGLPKITSMKFRTSRLFLSRLASRRAACALVTATLLTLGCISAAHAATYSWDGGTANITGTSDGVSQGGAGTWSTSIANWDPGAGLTDVGWPTNTGNLAYFGGTAGAVTTVGSLSVGGMLFGTAGYTIGTGATSFTLGTLGIDTSALTSGTTTINQALTTGNNATLTTGSGHTLALGGLITAGGTSTNTYTLTFTNTGATTTTLGTGQTNLTGGLNAANNYAKVNFNGNVNWSAGTGTFGSSTTTSNYIGIGSGTAGTFTMTGGTITSYQGSGYSFFIGSGATGAMNISTGSFTLGTNTAVYIGNGYDNTTVGHGGTATGTLTLSGTGSFSTGTTTGSFYLGNVSVGGVGEIDLNSGGTLSTLRSITKGTATGSVSTGNTATLNFNGGTLQATGANTTLITGLTVANVRNGGAIIDTQTFSDTIAQALVHSTINGDAATDGGLTKNGSGTLTLSGVNTYNGGTVINGGTLAFGNAAGTTQTLSGAISGAGALSQTGAGTTILTGANTYGGGTLIKGTLTLAADSTPSTANATVTSGPVGTGTLGLSGGTLNSSGTHTISNVVDLTTSSTIGAGGNLTLAGSYGQSGDSSTVLTVNNNTFLTGGINIANGSTNGRTDNFAGSGTITVNSVVSNGTSSAGSLNYAGTGNLILNNANTYTGTTTVTSGRVTLGNNTAASTGAITVGTANNVATGTLALTGGITVANAITLTGSRNDPISGGIAHIENVSGNNTITYNATNSFAIAGGGSGYIFQSDAGTLTLSGNLTGNSSATYTRPYYLIGAGNGVISGIIANGGASYGGTSLIKSGTGTWALTNANSYVGPTTVNAGTLDLGGSTAKGSLNASSVLTMGGGTLVYSRTGSNTQIVGGATFNSGGSTVTVSVSGDKLALGALTPNTGGTVVFNGPGTITTTTGNLNNTSSNGTSTTKGILGGYATYGTSDWASASGSTIVQYNGYTAYDYVAGWPGNVDGKDVTDDNNGYDGSYTNSVTINSLRFNTGSVSGSNNDPTVNINGSNNLTITSGGILVTPNLGVKYARINGGGLTTGSTADLVVQQNNTGTGHLQINSSIFGAGGLTKAGVGQLDLNGYDATYTGATTVNGGTMLVTAAITSTASVRLNSSGTLLLGANDRINDAATVTLNGGSLNTGGFKEGNSTGTATATTGLGALTLSASSTLDFGSGHSGSSVLAFANSSTQTWNGTLTLADFTPGTDYLNFASSTGLTSTQLGEISLNGFSATGLDSFGNVLFTAVPEPATWAAGALLAGVAAWHFRRRNVRRVA